MLAFITKNILPFVTIRFLPRTDDQLLLPQALPQELKQTTQTNIWRKIMQNHTQPEEASLRLGQNIWMMLAESLHGCPGVM